MQADNPLDVLAASLHHAAFVALPKLQEEVRDMSVVRAWTAEERREAAAGRKPYPTKVTPRRPHTSECRVVAMFPQTWGARSLGFGGLGQAAMTEAYTIVVQGPDGHLAVYWAGDFAYLVDFDALTSEQQLAWEQDMAKRWSQCVKDAVKLYAAKR